MAKLECSLRGNFNVILDALENAVLGGSFTASYEDGSDVSLSCGAKCSVRVYERYSWTGSNRVSLSMTLVGNGESCHLTAITSGGSQGVFFKVNTWGEEAFLDTIRETVQRFI